VADASGATTILTSNTQTSAGVGMIWSRSLLDGSATGNNGKLGFGDDLVQASVVGLAADQTSAYYGNNNALAAGGRAVGRIRLDGSAKQDSFIVDGAAPTDVEVSTTHVYWATGFDSRIGRARVDGTEVEKSWRSSLPHSAGSLALSATHLYFASYSFQSTNHVISRLDLATGVVTQLLTREGGDGTEGSKLTPEATPSAPSGLVVTASHLYVVTLGGWIARSNLDGSGLVNDWAQNTHDGSPASGSFMADTDGVYLYCNAGLLVTRVNLAGGTRTWSTIVPNGGANNRGITLAPKYPPTTVTPPPAPE